MPPPPTRRPGQNPPPRRARPPATQPAWARRRGPFTTRPQRDWIAITASGLPGLAALIALVFASLSIQATNDQLQIAQQGQITDRYNAAITNLGSPSIEVRLGGMYALQRLMQDSPRDQPTIIAVLSAFIRNRAPSPANPQPLPDSQSPTPADIQAALTVIATRNTANDGTTTVVDLDHTQLTGAQLDHANLNGADLNGTDLKLAQLNGAHLNDADLNSAYLFDARLDGAHLSGADLTSADLPRVLLIGADLNGAHLDDAYLYGASLRFADLRFADLSDANLKFTDLGRADLTGADLRDTNLADAYLRGVIGMRIPQIPTVTVPPPH